MAQPPDDSPRGSSPSFDRGLHRDRERRRARGDRVPRRRQRHLHERLGTTPGPGGWHEGNDVMSVRHQPAVAFDAGWVEKWSHPGRRPELHARPPRQERDDLRYIHLNNDLGPDNDNEGGCTKASHAPGLDYDDHVSRGQLVGFVGDSGDANGIQPHLHFEVQQAERHADQPVQLPERRRSTSSSPACGRASATSRSR